MYEHLRPEVTSWCAAAAVLLVEHLIFARSPLPYWPRYAMGIFAIGIGLAVLERMAGRPAGLRGFVIVASSGSIVLLGYGLRMLYNRAIQGAREAGYLAGRAAEANRRATGIARTRNDR